MPRARSKTKDQDQGWLKSKDHFKERGDDIPAGSHYLLRQQRKYLYYMRLIEHELPQLTAFRKPFAPPSSSSPLIVRSVDFAGEEHPLTAKRSVVVPVALLPLPDDAAFHALKLLAGVRWTPSPPQDSGFGRDPTAAKHGFIKISCEDFPEAAMNLKWISDTLDRLMGTANKMKHELNHIAIDTRHLEAKARKAKKGDHAYGRGQSRPTIRDFPQEWLPKFPPLDKL